MCTSLSVPALVQYYFETIFPRIPKPVMDNMIEELKARKLPTTPKVGEYP
jgi:pre-mRNA-splicing factor 38B